jgi:uncharacterized protein
MYDLEFNVSQLLRSTVGTKVTHTITTDEPLRLDTEVAEDITGVVTLLRTNFGILTRAHFTASVELSCGRCLEPYVTSIATTFEEEYLPVVDVLTGLPVQSERRDEEETFRISPSHVVDLTEAVRQHLLLAIPMQTICSEECRGLCVNCGQNLNTGTCTCTEETESHPFAALAVLLTNGNER